MNTGHRLRAGTHAALDITTDYEIGKFPVQSDQGVLPWGVNTLILEPQEFRTPLSFKKIPQGYLSGAITFSGLSFGMYDYLLDTFYPTGLWWAAVSGMTYNERNEAVFFQAIMHRPDRNTLIKPGYSGVTFELVKGVIL